jgi:glycosyltransferase involved in cell wall biosynthesis
MSSSPQISVVIPTYQRSASVERVLRSLAAQTLPQDQYEVIVAIDGSTDGTRKMVENFQAPYALLALWQPNRGRAAARNSAIRSASGRLIVMLDDDMEPDPGFLSAHLQAHSANSAKGVLGAVPILLDATSSPLVQYIGKKFNRHLDHLTQPGTQLHLRDFYAGNFSIPREVLFKVGLFDESFKRYGNEDLELFLRLAEHGISVIYSAEALAYQHYEKDFQDLAHDTIDKGRTAVLLAKKRPDATSELSLSAYRQGSRKWLFARGCLLALSRYWAALPLAVVRLGKRLERRLPEKMPAYYYLALDFFYWRGVRIEQDQAFP